MQSLSAFIHRISRNMMLYYIIPFYTILYSTILYYATLCYALLWYAVACHTTYRSLITCSLDLLLPFISGPLYRIYFSIYSLCLTPCLHRSPFLSLSLSLSISHSLSLSHSQSLSLSLTHSQSLYLSQSDHLSFSFLLTLTISISLTTSLVYYIILAEEELIESQEIDFHCFRTTAVTHLLSVSNNLNLIQVN